MSSLHSKQVIADGIHSAISYQFANNTARTAVGAYDNRDLGKLAWQTSNNSVWLLTAVTSPGPAATPTWELIALAGSGTIREVLTANRTYFVRTDGNDSNTGLVNTSGGAFATLQKAIDVIAQLDTNGYAVTIQLADGTYTFTGNTVSKPITGGGQVIILGNTSSPGNVIVTSTAASRTLWIQHPDYVLRNFRLQGGSAFALQLDQRTRVEGMGWGPASTVIGISASGYLFADAGSGNWTITGNAARFIWGFLGGVAYIGNITMTLTGTPVYSDRFALSEQGAQLWFDATVFSGSATGPRYTAHRGGGIITTNALPGSTGGTATSPGYYVGP